MFGLVLKIVPSITNLFKTNCFIEEEISNVKITYLNESKTIFKKSDKSF